jgi:sec-independent protein translocase protein TatA
VNCSTYLVAGDHRAITAYSARAPCKCNVSFVKGAKTFEGLLQPMHLLVIFGIALLVFGPKKLPELGKGIGEGIRSFKSAFNLKEDSSDTKASVAHD